mgnify:CR=1 FL=1
MHRFILKKVFFLCCIYGGLVHAGSFSAAEQSWIDAHPVVRFSIHEKYAAYLAESNNRESAGPFKALLSKLEECTRQQYLPVWRKSDSEGLKQLRKGEVDFIIDPPSIDDHVLKFGSLSEAIFWGHDAVVTKTSNKLDAPSLRIAYFDRGLENAPSSIDAYGEGRSARTPNDLMQSLIKNDVEALVMPIRLARQLIQEHQNSDLKIDGLYSRNPFSYRWLISNQDTPLHDVLGHFLDDLDPLTSRQLFALGDESKPTSTILPWFSAILIFMVGGAMFYQLQRKYFHQKKPLAFRFLLW